MTEQPEPEPAEYRREMVRVTRDMATARRYLAAFESEDPAAMAALVNEIARSGRPLFVLAAMAVQTLDFGHVLAAGGVLRDRHDQPVSLQAWLDAASFEQLDAAADGELLLRGDDDLNG